MRFDITELPQNHHSNNNINTTLQGVQGVQGVITFEQSSSTTSNCFELILNHHLTYFKMLILLHIISSKLVRHIELLRTNFKIINKLLHNIIMTIRAGYSTIKIELFWIFFQVIIDHFKCSQSVLYSEIPLYTYRIYSIYMYSLLYWVYSTCTCIVSYTVYV